MEKRFIPPATTFIAGAVVWIALLLLDGTRGLPLSADLGLGALAVVLVFYSGLLCRRARGPRYGGPVRGLFLIVMAAVTFWRIGPAPGALLAFGAVATTLLAFAPPLPARSES